MKTWLKMSITKKQMLVVITQMMIKNDSVFGTIKKLDKKWEEYCFEHFSSLFIVNIINRIY
jgi:hypothetical protein